MKNNHLFRGIDLTNVDQQVLECLDERISKRIEDAEYFARHPFESNGTKDSKGNLLDEVWKLSIDARAIYTDFPQGGYDSEQQAEIALSLWKTNSNQNYQDLYKLSKFIWQGLQ